MARVQTAARRGGSPIPAGAGIGLRFPHHAAFIDGCPPVGWVEVHSENYLRHPARSVLERVRRDRGVSLHSVGLSLGSAGGIDADHLARLAELTHAIEPGLVSEHLAWGAVDHDFLADLLPLPLTEESLAIVCRNVERAQETLGRTLLIENPATYLQFAQSTIPETAFLRALVERTGCGLICDINNIVVSAANHGWDAETYLRAFPGHAIGEYHLAGHQRVEEADGVLLIDTHDRPVADAVWHLYARAVALHGAHPTLIEWDADIPPLDVLLREAARADAVMEARHAHAA